MYSSHHASLRSHAIKRFQDHEWFAGASHLANVDEHWHQEEHEVSREITAKPDQKIQVFADARR